MIWFHPHSIIKYAFSTCDELEDVARLPCDSIYQFWRVLENEMSKRGRHRAMLQHRIYYANGESEALDFSTPDDDGYFCWFEPSVGLLKPLPNNIAKRIEYSYKNYGDGFFNAETDGPIVVDALRTARATIREER